MSMIWRRLSVMIAGAVVCASAAGAEECHDRADKHWAGWAYREIDGRRCYYEGRRMLPKSALHWAAKPAAAAVATASEPHIKMLQVKPLYPVGFATFKDRWLALPDMGISRF
jgi:hypothetical protein